MGAPLGHDVGRSGEISGLGFPNSVLPIALANLVRCAVDKFMRG